MAHSLREEDLVAFQDAVAGHEGVLTDPSGELVIKPCTITERSFYEASLDAHTDLFRFFPTFMGTITLANKEEKAALRASAFGCSDAKLQEQPNHLLENRPCSQVNPFGNKLDTTCALVLENSAAGFRKPSIIDVKLGRRLWDDKTSAEKRRKLDKVADETTSGSMGFRITGMRIWEPEQGSTAGHYKFLDKTYGRSLTCDTISQGFEDFFYLGTGSSRQGRLDRQTCLELCLAEISSLLEALEKEESRMFSASILIVMEADEKALANKLADIEELQGLSVASDGSDDRLEGPENPSKVLSVKLIDFAHAAWTPGLGPDENVIFGLRSLKTVLQSLLAREHSSQDGQ